MFLKILLLKYIGKFDFSSFVTILFLLLDLTEVQKSFYIFYMWYKVLSPTFLDNCFAQK
jgi:hypothetical protein